MMRALIPRANARPNRMARRFAFTLIEVLVVVAIIALLLAILIPSLAQARENTKRAMCASNLHQQCLAMSAYAGDYRGFLPFRGWFTYTISEHRREAYGTGGTKKVLINIAMLIDKYLGKNWDVLYCPCTITDYRDSGLKQLWDSDYSHTYGGYNYAVPMGQRAQLPQDKRLPEYTNAAPRWDIVAYPRDARVLAPGWLNFLKKKAPPDYLDPNGEANLFKMMPVKIQALVMDFGIGGGKVMHPNGINVSYSDGHVKFVSNRMPQGTIGSSYNPSNYEIWYYITNRP